jgi:nicotinamidase-related amidase
MCVVTTLIDTVRTPAYIVEWFQQLQVQPLAQAVDDPTAAAVFSADMVVGFCQRGSLASARIGALTPLVVDLFQRAYAYGIRHFVLLQDTHHPQTPEFRAFPPHCIRGTEEVYTIVDLQILPFASAFPVIEKNSLHPALGTPFDYWLNDHPEVRTAIVAGNCTDLCVYQLAMHLRLRANAMNLAAVRVIVPAGAVTTYDVPEEAPPSFGAKIHPGDLFHRLFLYHLALNGVEVVRALC